MYKKVDLNEWEKAGEGVTADSYNKKGDDSLLLKLFYSSRTHKEVEHEFDQCKKIEKLGIKTAKVYEIVEYENRLGIIFERLVKKVSYSRLCANAPSKIKEYAREYAIEAKKFHQLTDNENCLSDIKTRIIDIIKANKSTRKKDQKLLIDYINKVEDTNSVLHGDLHTGNLLYVKDRGNYWIDFGGLAKGNYWFDIGTTYLVCKELSWIKFMRDNVHMSKEQLSRFWESFRDTYFDGQNSKEIDRKARIFALFRLIERIVYAGKSSFELFLCRHSFGKILVKLVKEDNERGNA